MRLLRIIAGLSCFALAASLNAAQHGGGSAHAGGGGHAAVSHPAGVGVPHPASAGNPGILSHPSTLPPISGVQMQHGRIVYMPPSAFRPNQAWRFPQFAPFTGPSPFGPASVLYQRHWILRPEADIEAERFRRFRYYRLPYFLFLGGGGLFCDPFYPGYFGPELWYDNQFSCFGIPWFGVNSYPSNFLAPDFAYEPWAQGLQQSWDEQMYPSVDGQTVGALDMTAEFAERESAESNPSIQITQLVLKEGIIIGLVDYWVQGDMLYYITTYNRQNSVPLDRVDMEKTVEINSDRGVPFVLRERPAPSPNPGQPTGPGAP